METTTSTPTSNGYTTNSTPDNNSNKCILVVPRSRASSASEVAQNNNANTASATASAENLSTPKKSIFDALARIKLNSPSGCDIRSLQIPSEPGSSPLLKDRYLLTTERTPAPATAPDTTKSSYKHFVDLSSSNLKCVDIYNGEQYLCKIINEPLHKVQMAYFKLKQDNCQSDIYEHQLVRSVRDVIPMSSNRTYAIVPKCAETEIYEDLHTYIRNKRRLGETEARSLFHQICQTVQVCHRNGIILRDLKLKRFYFIDEERTKIQYESLEGSMILNDPDDDTLYDKIGCPLYTAPELLCPNSTYAGKPADMWSLGVILYTMLVGQYPFYEKGGCNLITIIRHCQVQIPTALSKPVRWLLRNLLRRIPDERLRAEHIFLHPWLAELKPAYMYVTVDAVFSDSESEDENRKSKNHGNNGNDKDDDDCEQPKAKRVKIDYFDDIATDFSMDDVGEMG